MMTRLILFISAVLFALSGWAKVDMDKTVPVVIPQDKIPLSDFTAGLVDLQQHLPSANDGDDGNKVAGRIGDQALQHWWNSPDMANNVLVRTTNKVQEKTKVDVNMSSGSGVDKIDHKVTFQMMALQTTAKVEYTGWVKADWNYNVANHAQSVELLHKVGKNKDLTLSHTAASDQDMNSVGLRWGF